jgi:hypothetical protein
VEKRKEFEHYKNRAQTEMAIALQARGAYHINSLRGQTFYEGSCASVHPSTHTQIQHTHTHPANRNVTRPASYARAEALHTIARTHARAHAHTNASHKSMHAPAHPPIHPSIRANAPHIHQSTHDPSIMIRPDAHSRRRTTRRRSCARRRATRACAPPSCRTRPAACAPSRSGGSTTSWRRSRSPRASNARASSRAEEPRRA